jgi:hypothetical protein
MEFNKSDVRNNDVRVELYLIDNDASIRAVNPDRTLVDEGL